MHSAVCRVLGLEHRNGNVTKRPIRRGKICMLYVGKPLVWAQCWPSLLLLRIMCQLMTA